MLTCFFMFFYVFLCFSQWLSYQTTNRRRLGEGSLDRKLKVLVPFLRKQKDWRAAGPILRLFFSKSLDRSFEISVLFSIVERLNNHALRKRSVSYKINSLLTYSIVQKGLNHSEDIYRGGFKREELSTDGFSMWKDNWRGSRTYRHCLKNEQKKYIKKCFFFQLKARINIKTQSEHQLFRIWRGCLPPQQLPPNSKFWLFVSIS